MSLADNMLEFNASLKLPISPENEVIIPLAAKAYWWIPWMEIAPRQAIENHFKKLFAQARSQFEYSLIMSFWELNREQVDAIMGQYDNAAIITSEFTDEN